MTRFYITVINRKADMDSGIYIGRPTPLSNPFAIGRDGTREQVIEKYAQWLDARLAMAKQTPERTEFERLVNLTHLHGHVKLACWCAPLACHGDILAERIREKLGEIYHADTYPQESYRCR